MWSVTRSGDFDQLSCRSVHPVCHCSLDHSIGWHLHDAEIRPLEPSSNRIKRRGLAHLRVWGRFNVWHRDESMCVENAAVFAVEYNEPLLVPVVES